MKRAFEGKVALVTGGTSGIGRETAILFASAGAKIVVAGRREPEGNETIEVIRAGGGNSTFVKTDVTKTSEVEALIKKTVESYGRIDIAFNNAGTEGVLTPIVRQREEDWDRTIETNLKGVWLCLKHEIRQMLVQGSGGAIVNMGSVFGLTGSANASAYSASKHAVIGLTKSAALEVARSGIRINAICPAAVDTPMAKRAFGNSAARNFLLSHHPLGRFATAAEVAQAVLWLCSDAASFVTGQSLVLDGGFLAGPNPPG